jgi:predicted dehydrogenase
MHARFRLRHTHVGDDLVKVSFTVSNIGTRAVGTSSSAAWEFDYTMARIDIGIIGCGNISHSYLKGATRSEQVRVKCVADMRMEAAQEKAAEYGVQAVTMDRLLADPDIQIVINLTVPLAHAQVSMQVVEAAKHVYSEKPLVTRHAEGEALMLAAAAKGVRVGCAPDTFLGAGHQACRHAIDAGRIGRPIAGSAFFATHGMEHWHPNPEFFFKRGGGPMLDIGPYYVTQLVNLLGPVVRVAAQSTMGYATRIVSSEPLKGSIINVEVPTTVNGVLSFANGSSVTITTSWDVWKHRRIPFEIYGSEGSMLVPDPNFFGGEPMVTERDGEWIPLDVSAHPFGIPNRYTSSGAHVADYRIIGLLDMAAGVRDNRPHRASGELAMHVLEVLDAFERSSTEGRHVMIASPCERPHPLPLGKGEEVFAS